MRRVGLQADFFRPALRRINESLPWTFRWGAKGVRVHLNWALQ